MKSFVSSSFSQATCLLFFIAGGRFLLSSFFVASASSPWKVVFKAGYMKSFQGNNQIYTTGIASSGEVTIDETKSLWKAFSKAYDKAKSQKQEWSYPFKSRLNLSQDKGFRKFRYDECILAYYSQKKNDGGGNSQIVFTMQPSTFEDLQRELKEFETKVAMREGKSHREIYLLCDHRNEDLWELFWEIDDLLISVAYIRKEATVVSTLARLIDSPSVPVQKRAFEGVRLDTCRIKYCKALEDGENTSLQDIPMESFSKIYSCLNGVLEEIDFNTNYGKRLDDLHADYPLSRMYGGTKTLLISCKRRKEEKKVNGNKVR